MMKNSLLIFSLLTAALLSTKGQFIENKVHFQCSYGIVNTFGNKDVVEGGFVLPSLFANYSKGSKYSFRTTYKLKPNWSVGAEFSQIKFDDWEYGEGEDLFENSSSIVSGFGVSVKIHTKFRQEGIYNKLQVYANFSPTLSNVKLTLQNSTFSLQPQDNISIGKIERNSYSWGMNTSFGLIYSVTQKLSIFAEGGMLISKLESQLHNDKFLKASYLNIGFSVQLVKAKRFY